MQLLQLWKASDYADLDLDLERIEKIWPLKLLKVEGRNGFLSEWEQQGGAFYDKSFIN